MIIDVTPLEVGSLYLKVADSKIISEETISNDQKNKIDISKADNCKVKVRTNEGGVPHFHIIGDNFETCICIFIPLYFAHNNKTAETLPNSDLKELNSWLKKQYHKDPTLTNWEKIAQFWDDNNSEESSNFKRTATQPDYVGMKPTDQYNTHKEMGFKDSNSEKENK